MKKYKKISFFALFSGEKDISLSVSDIIISFLVGQMVRIGIKMVLKG